MVGDKTEQTTRLRTFAKFFKSYMSVSALITAALPIPITSFQFIPTFNDQTKYLSVYTSLFCFLLLGYIFYIRHYLARLYFKRDWAPNAPQETTAGKRRYLPSRMRVWLLHALPLIFILISLYSVLAYTKELNSVVANIEGAIAKDSSAASNFGLSKSQLELPIKAKTILENVEISKSPNDSIVLLLYYLGIFLFAEAAFILMAIKEYLQDLLKISEEDIINFKFDATK
jgi:hypothetical protein